MKLPSCTVLSRVGLALGLMAFVSPAGCREGGEEDVASGEQFGLWQGKTIPKKYTGEGEDVSPPLEPGPMPAGTKESAHFATIRTPREPTPGFIG